MPYFEVASSGEKRTFKSISGSLASKLHHLIPVIALARCGHRPYLTSDLIVIPLASEAGAGVPGAAVKAPEAGSIEYVKTPEL
jgi:hypothetical protein